MAYGSTDFKFELNIGIVMRKQIWLFLKLAGVALVTLVRASMSILVPPKMLDVFNIFHYLLSCPKFQISFLGVESPLLTPMPCGGASSLAIAHRMASSSGRYVLVPLRRAHRSLSLAAASRYLRPWDRDYEVALARQFHRARSGATSILFLLFSFIAVVLRRRRRRRVNLQFWSTLFKVNSRPSLLVAEAAAAAPATEEPESQSVHFQPVR